jgi:pyruvyltransferase
LTREALQALGHKCPEVYGDPAVLMPLVYTPKTQRNTQDYVVVNHFLDNTEYENCVPILTTDYSGFIDKLYCAQRVISSSLHGIILAEAYGVPAVLFLPEATKDYLTLYKYQDYYYGTGRKEFPVAHTIQEALSVKPCAIPNWKPIRENLIEAFPADLWE